MYNFLYTLKMTTGPLRPNEKKVFQALAKYIDDHGFSPTYRELQELLGLKAVGSVQKTVQQLIRKGHVVNTGKWRGLALAEPSDVMAVRIPLSGSVAAGAPIEAIETQDYVDVARTMIQQGQSYFALRVKGDSMIEDHIVDGDIVVIRKQKTPNQNDIVVALIDDEATLKRFHKSKGVIELHPANKNYKPIKVDEAKSFEILGILSGIIRKY
jgi:SOS regulatory protein LexA